MSSKAKLEKIKKLADASGSRQMMVLVAAHLAFVISGIVLSTVTERENKASGYYLLINAAGMLLGMLFLKLISIERYPTLHEVVGIVWFTFVINMSALPLEAQALNEGVLETRMIFRQAVALGLEMCLTYSVYKMFKTKSGTNEALVLGLINAGTHFVYGSMVRDEYIFNLNGRDIAPSLILTTGLALAVMFSTAAYTATEEPSEKVARFIITLYTVVFLVAGLKTKLIDPKTTEEDEGDDDGNIAIGVIVPVLVAVIAVVSAGMAGHDYEIRKLTGKVKPE